MTATERMAIADSERLVRRWGIKTFARGAGAWLKDGIHDMAVVLRHDGRHVTEVRGWTHQYPWTTCPGATDPLQGLVGAEVSAGAGRASLDPGAQCTHLLDLARLATAWAARGGRVQYRASVTRLRRGEPDEMLELQVRRDGQLVLAWTLRDYVVVAPADMAGHGVDGRAVLPERFSSDALTLEAIMMGRRAVKMFRGRDRVSGPLGAVPPAERGWMMGACYTFQPHIASAAERATQPEEREATR